SAAGLPAGLSIDSSTGVISGTLALTAARSAPYGVTVNASNGSQGASQSFHWSVTSILITDPGPQTSDEGRPVALPIQAKAAGGASLSYSAGGLPSGLSLDASTGLISGAPASGSARSNPYVVTIYASSGSSVQSQTFSWTVTHVALTNPGDQINAQ